MKVLWLSHLVPYPPKGGVLQRSYNLIRETARYHDVYLLAFIQKALLKTMFKDVQSGLEEAEHALGTFCKAVKFIPIPSESQPYGQYALALKSLFTQDSYTVNWLKSDAYQHALLDWKSQYKFDVVHADTISLAPYIKLFPEAKTALDHHNIESHMMLRRAKLEKNLLKKIYFHQEGLKIRAYENKICPIFNINITCSELDTQRLQQDIPNTAATVIPNGVDIEYFKPENTAKQNHSLVFAGGLNWYPNRSAIEFFIEKIWPLLKSTIPDTEMNLIGKHPASRFIQLAQKDTFFKVLGFVEDVRPYINQSAIYICPILDGGGTKLKILDALAMGATLVASPEACEGIAIEHRKHAFIAHTPEEYVEYIKLLFDNPELCSQLASNARKLAISHYSYASIGKKLSEVYENL